MTWLRVDAGLGDSRLVDVLRTACGLSKAAAMGSLVALWTRALLADTNGYIGTRSDAWIEDAAEWTGERGAFAAVIREHHLNAGRIKDWDEYQGVLEDRRAADRERKRQERERKKNGLPPEPQPEVPPSVPPMSRGHPPVTFTPTKTRTTSSSSSARAKARDLASRLPADIDRTALAHFLHAVPSPLSWVHELTAMLDAMPGHEFTPPARLGKAIRDYVLNGKCGKASIRQFRAYVRNLAHNEAHPDPPSLERSSRSGARSAGEQQLANILGPLAQEDP